MVENEPAGASDSPGDVQPPPDVQPEADAEPQLDVQPPQPDAQAPQPDVQPPQADVQPPPDVQHARPQRNILLDTSTNSALNRQLSVQGASIILATTFAAGVIFSASYNVVSDLKYQSRHNKTSSEIPPIKVAQTAARLEVFKRLDITLLDDCLHLRSAAQSMFKSEYEQALSELDLVSKPYRERDQSWYALEVECLLSSKQFEKILVLANQYIENHPDEYSGYMWRGQTEEQLKEYDAAIKDFSKSLQVFQSEKNDLAVKLHTTPQFAQSASDAIEIILFKHLGACSERLDHYKAAGEYYQKALSILSDRKLAFLKVTSDQVHVARSALSELSSAIQARPREPGLYAERAELCKALGKYDLALKDYNQIETLSPNKRFKLYYERAGAYWGLKNYKLAVQDLRKVFKEDPLYERSHDRQKRYAFLIIPAIYLSKSEALKRLDMAVIKQPDEAINYYCRGVLELAFSDFEPGAKDLEVYLSLHPQKDASNARANVYLGLCRALDGRKAESDIILSKVCSEYSNHEWWRAVASYLHGDINEAALLAAAGNQKGLITQSQYFIGQKYKSRGDVDNAEIHYQRGVQDGAPVVDEYYLCKLALLPELEHAHNEY